MYNKAMQLMPNAPYIGTFTAHIGIYAPVDDAINLLS